MVPMSHSWVYPLHLNQFFLDKHCNQYISHSLTPALPKSKTDRMKRFLVFLQPGFSGSIGMQWEPSGSITTVGRES